jgi:hypothetical protein
MLQPVAGLCRGFGNFDFDMPGCLRSDDAKRRMLHMDGETRLPDRQSEYCLVIGDGRRAELRFLGMKPVFNSGISDVTLGVPAEIIQFPGLCSYEVAVAVEIVFCRQPCAACATVKMFFVNQIAGDALRVEPDLRPQSLMKFFKHRSLLPRHRSASRRL